METRYMRRNMRIPLYAALLFIAVSCTNNTKTPSVAVTNPPAAAIMEKVMTAEDQAKLTPDGVIASLKEGNQRFTQNKLTPRNYAEQVRKSGDGQYPKAVILSCLDSRIPVELVFDEGIGDAFVARIAGNFVNTDILGSMEYGCKVSGAKVILVLGHEHCGAIKSAIDGVKLGNITAMLEKIKPAIKKSSAYTGDKSSKNYEYVDLVCRNNVLHTIDEIKAKSPILKEMADHGKIKIVGAIYELGTGEVKFLE